MIRIQISRLPHGEGLPLPAYATPGAAGLDVVAAEDLDLQPGQRLLQVRERQLHRRALRTRRADGQLLTCEPATVLPMAQRYFLF